MHKLVCDSCDNEIEPDTTYLEVNKRLNTPTGFTPTGFRVGKIDVSDEQLREVHIREACLDKMTEHLTQSGRSSDA